MGAQVVPCCTFSSLLFLSLWLPQQKKTSESFHKHIWLLFQIICWLLFAIPSSTSGILHLFYVLVVKNDYIIIILIVLSY